MPEVVSQADRFRKRLVQIQRAGRRARDLRNFDRMSDAGPVEIALVIDEHLGLVDEAPECARMDDAIAVTLELTTEFRLRLGVSTPA